MLRGAWNPQFPGVLGSRTYCPVSAEMYRDFRGRGSGVLGCKSFFPLFLWLVPSLFVDLERTVFLAGYKTLWMPFGVSLSFFLG
jgi:hypothetical protein